MTQDLTRLNLSVVVVTATEENPRVLISQPSSTTTLHALPETLFKAKLHRTFEEGIRDDVQQNFNLGLGYVEQLYTFGDQDRDPQPDLRRAISVGYVALTRLDDETQTDLQEKSWIDWYDFFPWEDWRQGPPTVIEGLIMPRLQSWINDSDTPQQKQTRQQRVRLCFGQTPEDTESHWDSERVLERYELLYSASLIPEARIKLGLSFSDIPTAMGKPMALDHRRILATAISRIRAKIKYRPVIFELVPPRFTLFYLQQVVESLAGTPLHKQNFRRLVEAQGLVERTREFETTKRGRPAELFKFRSDVVLERPAPGVRSGYRSHSL